jgi:hypothetical protein
MFFVRKADLEGGLAEKLSEFNFSASFDKLCVTLRYFALLCGSLRYCALLCITLRYFALLCVNLRKFALL